MDYDRFHGSGFSRGHFGLIRNQKRNWMLKLQIGKLFLLASSEAFFEGFLFDVATDKYNA